MLGALWFFSFFISLSLFFYPFRRSSRRSDLLRQDLMLFPGEWNRHDMLREREGLWNLFFVVVFYWVTKSLSLKIRCRREKRLTWGLFFFWRTVAAGGNHQRGEKLMREDAPHFEENERRRLVVSFFFFFFTSFGAESLLSLMCPNTTGKRQNRKRRSEGKAVKRGFVRSEGIWCHGRSGTVTAGLDTSHRTKTGLNWQTHKFLSLLFSFNGHSLIRN